MTMFYKLGAQRSPPPVDPLLCLLKIFHGVPFLLNQSVLDQVGNQRLNIWQIFHADSYFDQIKARY